jgi:hypothetical protein
MVALNILFVLLGFINSINRRPKNIKVTQGEQGVVVLSEWEC